MAHVSDAEAEADSESAANSASAYRHQNSHSVSSDGRRPNKKQKTDGPRPMCTNCEQCQLRKGKCDGGRPICGWCAANNKPCLYQEKKKPGLKAGYGRDLERRLTTLEENLGGREEELERKVRELEERLEGHERVLEGLKGMARMGSQGGGVQGGMVGAVGMGYGGSGARAGMAATAPSPAASLHPSQHSHHSNGSMQATSPYQTHTNPPSGPGSGPGPSMFASPGASSHLSPHNLNGYRPSQHPTSTNSHMSLHPSQSSQQIHQSTPTPAFVPPPNLKLDDPELPPFDLAFDLLQLYFDRINPWFPLLDRKSTINKMVRNRSPSDEILLHAIIATTIRYLDGSLNHIHNPEYAAQRSHYYTVSKRKVLLHSFESPSIRSLQALVVLCLDMVGAQTGGPGMFLLASIARCATQLGLTSETFSLSATPDYPSISTLRASVLPEPADFIEDETRRRLFWLIYVLDRDTTVATAHDFVLDSTIVDRKLPCSDSLFAANTAVETRWFATPRRSDCSVDYPENLGAFSYLIELKGLLSEIHGFLRKPVNINRFDEVEGWRATYREIDRRLKGWRGNLPFEWRNTDQVLGLGDGGRAMSGGWVLLQVSYYTVFIRMHSSAAYPPYRTPLFSPSPSAAHQCVLAVEKIVALTKYVIRSNLLSSQGPPFAFSLWVSARVLLVHGSTIEKHVSGEIHFLINTLRKLGQWWPVAGRYADILGRVMGEYEDSVNAGNAGEPRTNGDGHGGIAPRPRSVAILADMRRCAYDLDTLISNEPLQRPVGNYARLQNHSFGQAQGIGLADGAQMAPVNGAADPKYGSGDGVPDTGTGTPLLTEMDYLETFNFFNYPRMGAADPAAGAGFNAYYGVPSDAASQAGSLGGFGNADLGGDWLSTHFT